MGRCHPICNQSQRGAPAAAHERFALSDEAAQLPDCSCHFSSWKMYCLHPAALGAEHQMPVGARKAAGGRQGRGQQWALGWVHCDQRPWGAGR